ncbi:uncharacterized protein LOC131648689 [Vicia villosa]|uniref:uncharacterized protein LOC131648689 n=1 Tax=Vicia villosa TaxID=3911 RepID=UPI00273C0966|nr:uncharacterized protein LOC131648689 [Vicia villosa]
MYDPWLREKGSCFLNGPQVQSTYELFVKDLLLPNIKQWNVGKINQIFGTEGAAIILRVPLIDDVREDRLIWQGEQNGEYSVKSGYKLWKGIQSSNRREDRRDAGRFAVLLETLWRSRNNVVWEDTRDDALKIGLQAYHNWYDWFLAREDHNLVVVNNLSACWIPPSGNQLKCNVDASFNNVCGTTNRGWCFRDHLGRFISAGVSWDVGLLSFIEAEATALKEAIQNAISLLLSHVIFESDCQYVTKTIHVPHVGNSEFIVIIKTIQNMLLMFSNFEVKLIKRQATSVAHTLAKAANSWSRHSFFNNVPPYIEFSLSNDIN